RATCDHVRASAGAWRRSERYRRRGSCSGAARGRGGETGSSGSAEGARGMRPAIDHPFLLALAVILPIAAIILVITGYRRRRRRLERRGRPSMIQRLVPPNAAIPPGWRATRMAFAAAFAGVAIAGPRWGIERTVVHGEGVDIVLAVDASLSMMAQDERPNRL